MIQLIQQALLLGNTVSQVLTFLGNKMPNVAPAISNAKKRGYSDDDILKFLQGKIKVDKGQAERKLSEVEKNFAGAGIKSKEERQSDKAKFLKGALGLAGTALGAYGLYNQYKGIFSPSNTQVGPAAGAANTPPPTASGTPPQQPPNIPNTPQGGQTAQGQIQIGGQGQQRGMPRSPGMHQTSTASQPSAQLPTTTPLSKTTEQQLPQEENPIAKEKTKQEALGKFHNKLRQSSLREQLLKDYEEHYGPPSEAIKQLPAEDLEALTNVIQQPSTSGQPIDKEKQNEISENSNIGQNDQSGENVENNEFHNQNDTKLEPQRQEQKPKEPIKLTKGSQVITPSGDIGSIEDLPGKTAKINVDGKKEVVDSDELTTVPENEEEILGIYEKLIQKIPEHLRSSMLNWVGYDPERNILQVKFHNGSSYTYENIPSEFADKLKDVDFLAKTTGGNYYGNWEAGENSRGAGVSALIKDLQKAYGGKGKEYSAKFNEVYSFMGLPEEKLREKLKNEREEKKKRKGSS